MPSLWALDLCGPQPVGVRPEYLHAVVSNILDEPDGHHDQWKAFTVRPLEGLSPERCRLVVGFLDDEATSWALDRIVVSPTTVRLGAQHFDRVGDPVLLAAESWAAMLEEAYPVNHVAFRFASPTFFRRGRTAHVLPAPAVVFGHLRRRWSDWAGLTPECPLDDRAIQVRRLDVRTVSGHLRGKDIIGFVGDVTYDVSGLDPHHRTALDAFAQLAPYAGCGAATTFGFGAVDRLEVDDASEP